MRILAVDPGVTTGLAWRDFTDGQARPPKTDMPRGFDVTSVRIAELIYDTAPELIVVERFTISAQTAKKSTAGSNVAIELIGVTRYLASEYGARLEEQSPADAMTFCDDKKLRRLGWYVKGPDHARDASRHLLLAAVRHNLIDLTQLLPGRPEPDF